MAAAAANDPADLESAIAKIPMPMEPSGTRPSSTLSPDSLPATTLPIPMPMPEKAIRMPDQRSSRPIISLPSSTTSMRSSAPRNQKYEMPSTVSQSGLMR
jgi:hypothetical protein